MIQGGQPFSYCILDQPGSAFDAELPTHSADMAVHGADVYAKFMRDVLWRCAVCKKTENLNVPGCQPGRRLIIRCGLKKLVCVRKHKESLLAEEGSAANDGVNSFGYPTVIAVL